MSRIPNFEGLFQCAVWIELTVTFQDDDPGPRIVSEWDSVKADLGGAPILEPVWTKGVCCLQGFFAPNHGSAVIPQLNALIETLRAQMPFAYGFVHNRADGDPDITTLAIGDPKASEQSYQAWVAVHEQQ